MPAFTVQVEDRDGVTVVRMVGWAGLDAQATLEREVTRLSAGAHPLLILDLGELAGIVSLSVSQFVLLHRAVKNRGGQVRIGGCMEDVRSVLVRCKLDSVMPIYPTLDEAIAAPVGTDPGSRS